MLLMLIGCISINEANGQDREYKRLDNVSLSLDSLNKSSELSFQTQRIHGDLQELYLFFSRQDQSPHRVADLIINNKQIVHIKDYLGALSLQQNYLIEQYDLGKTSWDEVRKVTNKQAELENRLLSFNEKQQIINGKTEFTKLPGDLPVLALNSDIFESEIQITESQINRKSLKKYYLEYQDLFGDYVDFAQKLILFTDELEGESVIESVGDPAFLQFLNRFEIKLKITEIKRDLYHKLFQISALMPEFSFDNYTQLYNPDRVIRKANNRRTLTLEENRN